MAREIAADLALPTVEQLDKLCRLVVFRRDRCCRRCGSSESYHWHHAYTRRIHATRWDLENTLHLCARCHAWWHNNEGAGFRWWLHLVGAPLERRVWARHSSGIRPDRRAVRLQLEAELERLDAVA